MRRQQFEHATAFVNELSGCDTGLYIGYVPGRVCRYAQFISISWAHSRVVYKKRHISKQVLYDICLRTHTWWHYHIKICSLQAIFDAWGAGQICTNTDRWVWVCVSATHNSASHKHKVYKTIWQYGKLYDNSYAFDIQTKNEWLLVICFRISREPAYERWILVYFEVTFLKVPKLYIFVTCKPHIR